MIWKRLGSNGQLSHVFAFMMAIIIIIATVILATKLIGSFTGTACGAGMGGFFSSLDQGFTANSAFGSRSTIDITSTCGAEQLCLVDSRDIGSTISVEHSEILVAVREGVEANVFLLDSDGLMERTYDERVILSNPDELSPKKALCINVTQSGFTVRTEGFGRYLSVSRP